MLSTCPSTTFALLCPHLRNSSFFHSVPFRAGDTSDFGRITSRLEETENTQLVSIIHQPFLSLHQFQEVIPKGLFLRGLGWNPAQGAGSTAGLESYQRCTPLPNILQPECGLELQSMKEALQRNGPFLFIPWMSGEVIFS